MKQNPFGNGLAGVQRTHVSHFRALSIKTAVDIGCLNKFGAICFEPAGTSDPKTNG